jgi:UDP-2,3-diacylglucosamine hydrolase
MPVKKKIAKRRAPQKASHHGKVYFFSDAHLGIGSAEEDREKERRIIRFLDSIKKDAEEIYIVGDLFDYWFEYKTVVPKNYFRLFTKLAELSEQGIQLSFIAGNHDYWVKEYFKEELGIHVHLKPLATEIWGKRFLIHHGDGLLKDDIGYRILKKILRNKVNIFLYSLIHPDITGGVARWSSHTSRQYTSNRTYEGNGMVEFATQKIRDGFDCVIMGHNHVPSRLTIEHGIYVNLGDWVHTNSYAIFDGKRLELKTWTN